MSQKNVYFTTKCTNKTELNKFTEVKVVKVLFPFIFVFFLNGLDGIFFMEIRSKYDNDYRF